MTTKIERRGVPRKPTGKPPGRPASPEDERVVKLRISLAPEVLRQIDEMAEEDGETRSGFIASMAAIVARLRKRRKRS